MSAHVIVPWATCSPTMLRDTAAEIERRFKIGHVTIQLEPGDHDAQCAEPSC